MASYDDGSLTSKSSYVKNQKKDFAKFKTNSDLKVIWRRVFSFLQAVADFLSGGHFQANDIVSLVLVDVYMI